MAETDKKIEAMEQEVSEAVNPQADAPKKHTPQRRSTTKTHAPRCSQQWIWAPRPNWD